VSVPSVTTNELDNQIGVAISTGDTLAICAPTTGGTVAVNTPVVCTRSQDVITQFGEGAGVEAACWYIENLGIPVLMCKTGITTAGAYGSIDVTGVTGTSVATTNAGTVPWDEYDVQFKVVTGGTIGTAGITFKYSLDNGRTWSVETALGTAVFYLIADANVRFNFAAGTLVTNDLVKVRTSAPLWNQVQLSAALAALRNSIKSWSVCLVMGNCGASDVAALETAQAAMNAGGRKRTLLGHTRIPTVGESDATYQTALAVITSGLAAPFSGISGGSCKMQSPRSGRRYERPAIVPVAGRVAQIREGEDPSWVGRGALPPSVTIADDNGNPENHDEAKFPGLDDQRLITLRSWEGKPGVYITNARIMSAPGSDFVYVQHRRVMNLADRVVRAVLANVSSQDILVNPTTGFILEEEAAGIETLVNAALDTEVVSPRNASDCIFTLSRSDNLLSTFELKGSARIVPLAYPKSIKIDIGFYNPALRVVAAQ
jgi:hypothetical protein